MAGPAVVTANFGTIPTLTLIPPNPVPVVPTNGQPTLVTYSFVQGGDINLLSGGVCAPVEEDSNITQANITRLWTDSTGTPWAEISVSVNPAETKDLATIDCTCPGAEGRSTRRSDSSGRQ
jgi:hypothetical protein